MKRVKLLFFSGIEVEFVDRDDALKWIEEIASRGTAFPIVIYGPEGCGKTAFLRQAAELLDSYGYRTIFASPLEGEVERALWVSPSIKELALEVLQQFSEPISRLVEIAFKIKKVVEDRFGKTKIALILDDIFQAIGLDRVESYAKTLLNMIEHPKVPYEKIVILVSSSEGMSRKRLSRHTWVHMYMMWNMDRYGFKQLYDAIPGDKPPFEDIWRLCGGNPRCLRELYGTGWRIDEVIDRFIKSRNLHVFTATLTEYEKNLLAKAVQDPDYLWKHLRDAEAEKLMHRLVDLNLVVELWDRKAYLWVDKPPPENDLGLGIGRYIAWQTPLHREAIRRTLELE